MRLRLFTFGGLRVECDGAVLTGPPAQRRRLALLALLAASDQRQLKREKAFGLLWPEQSTDRARHQLSESLYVLRRHLGEDAILSAQDDLVLNTDVIWSDVTEFTVRGASGDEDVARLYRGPFLDGFHLKEAPDFDVWAETTRDRLAREFGRLLETIALRTADRGDPIAAVEWWARLVEHDPYSSRVARQYINALVGVGERARAIQFGTTHTTRLREQLGVDPDPEFHAVLAGLQQPPARAPGAALVAKETQTISPILAPVLPETVPSGSPPTAREALGVVRRPSYRRAVTLTGVGVVTIAALFATTIPRSNPVPVVQDIKAFTFEPGIEIEPSISPDGRYVAYAGGTPSRLYLRQQGSRPVPLIMPDTGPPQHRPEWSPDGTRLAYDAGRSIFVIPALGGTPRQIVAAGWSPTWSPDGQRIAYALDDTIYAIDIRGGPPTRLAVIIEPAELTWSPDGRWIALTSGNDVWDGLIHIGNLAPSRILLIRTDNGRVLELTDRSAMNVAPAWGPDSRQLFFISNRAGARDIYRLRLDSDGAAVSEPTRLTTGLDAHSLAVSGQGDRIVYAMYRGRVNIWSLPIPSGPPASVSDAVALTTGTQQIESISVSPDHRWVYFTSDRAGNSDIWRVPRGGGEPVQITTDAADEFMPEQSPDGAWLAYYSLRHGSRDIFVRPTGQGDPVRVTLDPEEETQPHWSPDGTKLCYGQLSTRTSQHSIRMVQRQQGGWSAPLTLPDANGKPNRFFGCAGWLRDGRHLVVHDADRTMIAIMPDEGGAARVVYREDATRGHPKPIWIRVEPRTGTIYFRDWESIWLIDPTNPVPRQIARFDDPSRRSTRIEMESDGERVYFTLGDPLSDLFVANVSGLRLTPD